MVFYHVHAINNWECIVSDQLGKLVFSGLYRHMAACYSGVTGRTQQEVRRTATPWHPCHAQSRTKTALQKPPPCTRSSRWQYRTCSIAPLIHGRPGQHSVPAMPTHISMPS